VNLDPKLGIRCISTIFGLTYKGFHDPTDNGVGAFEDLSTGRLYRTANKTLLGCSIPIPFYELTPNLSRADIEQKLATAWILDTHGNWYENIPVVDLGPGEHDRLIRADDGPHLFDRSWLLCNMMAQKGNPMDNVGLTFWLVKGDVPYDVQGQDTPYKWI
jgi:hypothetical protein